ncbi:hypothetical protein CFELI_12280 [Corynebacterium felinum]|uniref:Uncharacterized protein n=1 Tax=Corynebacterium felinum TaxID=131318 RepID=A0ABU2B5G8_9CORY|nr:hypothetical protein [Corynebacterium felinum]WJY96037.1 hypothetical protein CFELI_12280 [Corynebacterium felinum]
MRTMSQGVQRCGREYSAKYFKARIHDDRGEYEVSGVRLKKFDANGENLEVFYFLQHTFFVRPLL